jgi:hypothetical protein
MTLMGQLSLKAIVLGLVAGLAAATSGLVIVIAAVGFGSGLDITDVAATGELGRLPCIQLPILGVWVLAVLIAGMTASRVADGRAARLHGVVLGGIALLGALAGISREDPAWAIALELVLTVPAAVAGAYVGRTRSAVGRWRLRALLAVFVAAAATLAASAGNLVAWTAFVAAGALLVSALHRHVAAAPAAASTGSCRN